VAAITNLDEILIRGALYSEDPVEHHIIKHLLKLRHQNKRLKDHIEKTGGWAQLKDIALWKPFDFYHYFCTKFLDRYGREYHSIGNIVLTYQRIEAFRKKHHITKQEYKEFIDTAFEKYFNKISIPIVAHLCNVKLYEHLMGDGDSFSTAEDYHELDRDLVVESAKFEDHVREWNDT